ncbi:hypothetical protein LWI29_024774 [Acer saccharum]|uniref:Uncharacterized protein n=1 Tax=Acer saccharum TaxID=4024 RepID=A0AA39VE73_ACESA|nr:hypothetical protein LWI29_024774 [Acer saccharum]
MEYNDLSKLCESLSLSEDDDIPETKIKGEVKREVGLILGKMIGRVEEIDLGYLGEEPRGKQPRGERDQHSGGTRQGLTEPKLTSRWKPKIVEPSSVAEIQVPPLVESDVAPLSTVNQKGKAKISAVKEVNYGLPTNGKNLTEIVLEDDLDIESPAKIQTKETINVFDNVAGTPSLGSRVKGPKTNRRGRPKLVVTSSNPYKKKSKIKICGLGSGTYLRGTCAGSSLDLDKNKWVDVVIKEWVERPGVVNSEATQPELADEVAIGGCPNLVNEDCQTSLSVLLNSVSSSKFD